MKQQVKKSKNSGWRIILVTFLFSLTYVVFRYHIFGGVPGKDFPLYVINKGISLTAFIILTFNFAFGPLKNLGVKVPSGWLKSRNILGMAGFVMAITHAFISFVLLKPAVYAKFFEPDGSFTFYAGLSMLAGIFSFVALWVYHLKFQSNFSNNKNFIRFITSRRFLIWALTLGAFHLFFMGFKGWINPSGWHGGMPPVSLVAFTFFAVGFVINLFGRE